MERRLVKLTWIFSTPVAHVLFVDTAGKVKVSLAAEERYRFVGKGFKDMQFRGPRNRGQSTPAQQPVYTDEIGVRCEGFVSQFGQKASEQPHVCEQNGGGGGAAKMTFSLSTFSGVLAVLTAPNMRLTTLPVSWIAVTHERIEFRPGIGLRGGILKRARKARLVATMERPILKYASTANARCSLIQNMIGTGCGGTKIDDLPSRTHPLLAPYLHPLPFGGFFKNVSFSTAPCMWFCEYTYAYLNVSIARIRTV